MIRGTKELWCVVSCHGGLTGNAQSRGVPEGAPNQGAARGVPRPGGAAFRAGQIGMVAQLASVVHAGCPLALFAGVRVSECHDGATTVPRRCHDPARMVPPRCHDGAKGAIRVPQGAIRVPRGVGRCGGTLDRPVRARVLGLAGTWPELRAVGTNDGQPEAPSTATMGWTPSGPRQSPWTTGSTTRRACSWATSTATASRHRASEPSRGVPSQSFTVPSLLEDAIRQPSGLIATLITPSAWPRRSRIS